MLSFFTKLENKTPPKYLIHISKNKINYKNPSLFRQYIKQTVYMKPNGLWLSGNISDEKSWIHWVVSNDWYKNPSKLFYYAVKLKKSTKLLNLNTREKIMSFHKKYYLGNGNINYPLLFSEGFQGIKFVYLKKLIDDIKKNNKINDFMWYFSLDCSCICIFNNELIEDIMELRP